jgi:hypothetical protein
VAQLVWKKELASRKVVKITPKYFIPPPAIELRPGKDSSPPRKYCYKVFLSEEVLQENQRPFRP